MADLNLPHLCLAPPLGVTTSELRRDIWQQSPWAIIIQRYLRDPKFCRFGTIPVGDGRSNRRRIHDDSIYRASIASCHNYFTFWGFAPGSQWTLKPQPHQYSIQTTLHCRYAHFYLFSWGLM